jgi:subtilisin family serine protease
MRKLLAIEQLEDRSLLATAVMLGQEFELPSWLTPEQVTLAQQAAAAITNDADNTPIYTSTNQSYPLIGVSDFLANPGFSTFNGSGYSIAILDTGADLDHTAFGPDLDSNGIGDRIVYQYDFADTDTNANDVNGHGTNVAGIAAGLATGANLIILKVFSDTGAGNSAFVEQALRWVAENAAPYNIVSVNMSLGDNGNYQTN